jgi:hypothetical protein
VVQATVDNGLDSGLTFVGVTGVTSSLDSVVMTHTSRDSSVVDARGMPMGMPAQSLLSRSFSWDVVDVGFPTCLVLMLHYSNKAETEGGEQFPLRLNIQGLHSVLCKLLDSYDFTNGII